MPAPPASPSKETIESPPESDVATTYNHLTGVRSENSSAEWLVNDSGNAAIVVHSSKDIFLEASASMQMVSQTHMHHVTSKITQYYGKVDRQVVQDENVVIGEDNCIHINSNQSVAVVGDHMINIAQKQVVQTGGAQKVEVASGDRTLDVLSGGFELTVGGGGAFTKNTTGDYTSNTIAKKTWWHNSNSTEQNNGDFFATKQSKEVAITAAAKRTVSAAGEASAMTGLSVKLSHSHVFETNIGIKNAITVGGERTFNSGTKDECNFLCTEIVSAMGQARKISLMTEKVKLLTKKEPKKQEKAKFKSEGGD